MTIALIIAAVYLGVALWLAEVPWRDILGWWGVPLHASPTWYGRLREEVPWWAVFLPIAAAVGAMLEVAIALGRKAGVISRYRKYGYTPRAASEAMAARIALRSVR